MGDRDGRRRWELEMEIETEREMGDEDAMIDMRIERGVRDGR